MFQTLLMRMALTKLVLICYKTDLVDEKDALS